VRVRLDGTDALDLATAKGARRALDPIFEKARVEIVER